MMSLILSLTSLLFVNRTVWMPISLAGAREASLSSIKIVSSGLVLLILRARR